MTKVTQSNFVTQGIRTVADAGSKLVSKTEGIDKTITAAISGLKLSLETVAANNTVCIALLGRLTPVKNFIGAVKIINSVHDLATFKKDPKSVAITVTGLAKTALLAVVNSLATAEFVAGVMGKTLTAVPLVKNGFVLAFSTASAINNGIKIHKARGNLKALKGKIKNWSTGGKKEKLCMSAKTDDKAKAALVKKYEKKIDADSKGSKIKKYQSYIEAINAGNSEKICSYKTDLYNAQNENTKIANKKSWIGLAADIGKFAVVAIATAVVMILGVTTAPVLIGIAALSFAVDGFGVFKYLWEQRAEERKVAEPKFAAAAAA